MSAVRTRQRPPAKSAYGGDLDQIRTARLPTPPTRHRNRNRPRSSSGAFATLGTLTRLVGLCSMSRWDRERLRRQNLFNVKTAGTPLLARTAVFNIGTT